MCFMCSVRVHALYVCLPLSPQKKAGPLSLTEEAREKFESREEVLADPSVSKTVVDIRQKVLQVLVPLHVLVHAPCFSVTVHTCTYLYLQCVNVPFCNVVCSLT